MRWHRYPATLFLPALIPVLLGAVAGSGLFAITAGAQEKPPLSERARALDANGNGVIDRDEAMGPMAGNFDTIDTDKSGTLDGGEIAAFFQGGGAKPAAGDKPAAAKPGRPASVAVDTVIEEAMSQTVPVLGRLVASEAGPIAARTSGAVDEMRVQVGDRVNQGDVLAVLDRERLSLERDRYAALVAQQTANLAAARSDLEKKLLELKRLEGIRKSAAFSQARYDNIIQDVAAQRSAVAQTKAQLAQAETQFQRSRIDLADAEIRAPFPGVVSARHTDVGAYMNVGNPVVTLINDLDLEIEADVPAARLGRLVPGESVDVRLDDGTGYRAVIRAIVPDENQRTRTRPVRLKADFGSRDKPLAANQSVTVLVPVGATQRAVTVAKDAVTERSGKSMVFLANSGVAAPREVTLGEAVGNRFVVLSGLAVGDKVVVRGNENLRPGQKLDFAGSGGDSEKDSSVGKPANGHGGG